MSMQQVSKAIGEPHRIIDFLYSKIAYGIVRPIDTRLSILLFDNPVGVGKNVRGRAKISLARRRTDDNIVPDRKVLKLREQGILNVGRPYDDDLIRRINLRYEELIEDEEHSFVRSEHDGEVYSLMIWQPSKNIPELAGLLTEEIRSVVEQYYGSNFRVKDIVTYRTRHVPHEISQKAEVFSDWWHADKSDIDELKLFVNLSDVTEDHGPFQVISKPQTERLVDQGAGHRMRPEKLSSEAADNVVKATGPAGSAVFANTELCYHRAGNPGEGNERDVVVVRFVPQSEPVGEDWLTEVDVMS